MSYSTVPKVSVIMPVFNQERYIAAAITSVLEQTIKNLEFIIVDDASTDSTSAIVTQFQAKDARIVFIQLKTNHGIAKSLNKGLEAAKGTYIARMDGDDRAFPQRLELQCDFLEHHPEITLVAGSYITIDESDRPLSTVVYEMSSDAMNKHLANHVNPIIHPTTMWRRNDHLFYRGKLKIGEDRDLWLRLHTENKHIYIIPDIVLYYRIHASSVSIARRHELQLYRNQINQWHFERIKSGTDSYDSFDPDTFIINTQENDPEKNFHRRKVFILYKEHGDPSLVRTYLSDYIRHYGLLKTVPEILFYILTFLPKKLVLKIIQTSGI